ncbi:hypothetical protein GCM10009745_23290 [Kribbella yunnanensis]|uniref:Methyltransferase domain-containing protein n=1 Tax=Kribbella yunnanensis TaxID=190194 RepID=A0ABN2GZQ1_9ACTN
MSTISNSEAIAAWSAMPTDAIEAYDDQGDFPKRHLMNGNLLRMLGPVDGRKVLDAGSGEGYLSRLLAARLAVGDGGVRPRTEAGRPVRVLDHSSGVRESLPDVAGSRSLPT